MVTPCFLCREGRCCVRKSFLNVPLQRLSPFGRFTTRTSEQWSSHGASRKIQTMKNGTQGIEELRTSSERLDTHKDPDMKHCWRETLIWKSWQWNIRQRSSVLVIAFSDPGDVLYVRFFDIRLQFVISCQTVQSFLRPFVSLVLSLRCSTVNFSARSALNFALVMANNVDLNLILILILLVGVRLLLRVVDRPVPFDLHCVDER